MGLSEMFRKNDDADDDVCRPKSSGLIRPAAVAGSFYPDDRTALKRLISHQLDYGRALMKQLEPELPAGCPKAVIVPHAGYVYSGTTSSLAYALLERGRGVVKRAVIIGPTHRVPVRGVACSSADTWQTPLGQVPVDTDAERKALNLLGARRVSVSAPALIVNDPTHAREHAVEVQIPFLQTIFGPDLTIVPLNAGDASPEAVGDVLRALWGGPETVVIISSDLSHYHPQEYARQLDEKTIDDIAHCRLPIHPRRACGAHPINGLLDVLVRGLQPSQDGIIHETSCETYRETLREVRETPCETLSGEWGGSASNDDRGTPQFDLRLLGRSTSGDDSVVALAGRPRPAMNTPDEPVVGYASFAIWQSGNGVDCVDCVSCANDETTQDAGVAQDGDAVGNPMSIPTNHVASGKLPGTAESNADTAAPQTRRNVLLGLARASIRRHLGFDDAPENRPNAIIARNPWLSEPGASFVTLTENGRLRGCVGTLEAYRSLGGDVADHAVDAAAHDPRFFPVTAEEYPFLDVEVSVLGRPSAMPVRSREELEQTLRPGKDGLILTDRHGRRATFLPQVWEQLPVPHDFVSHLLVKAGIGADYDWANGEIECERYEVSAYAER
nr:AmmeMemoRadiSam system protein B [Bifidobacterium scaligerum]